MTFPGTTPEKPRKYVVRNKEGEPVGKGEVRLIPVAALKIHHGATVYQRDELRAWVNAHLPFDPHKAGVLIVSDRAGGPYVLDGQQRLALARQSGILTVLCMVISGMTVQDEAAYFLDQDERTALRTWTKFRAARVAADKHAQGREAAILDRVVRAAGFEIAEHRTTARSISSVDALRRVYLLGGEGGEDLLRRTLETIGGVWLAEDKALHSQTIYGVGLFLDSAADRLDFDQGVVIKVLVANAPLRVYRLAQAIADKRGAVSVSSANFAEALVHEYDKRVSDPAKKLGGLTIRSKRRPKSDT